MTEWLALSLFEDGHSERGKLTLHCSFEWHFTNSDPEHLFMCLCPSGCFLWTNVRLDIWPVFYWVDCYIYIYMYWAVWTVCMFWRWIPCGRLPLQIFLPILRVVPVFPWGFPFGIQRLLRLIRSHFLICGLFFIFLRCRSTKNLLHSCQIVSCLYFFQEFHSIHPYN